MKIACIAFVSAAAIALALGSCAIIPHTERLSPPDSVSSLEYIELGGVRQLVLIRGKDRAKPILLFVHGGPGMPGVPLEHTMRYLEEDFIVAFWDQRGTGKSYPRTEEAFPIGRYVEDTEEIIRILLARFNKEKLYLIGHSWGSILGLTIARDRPELLYAYIGIGQYVNGMDQERISYEYALRWAEESGDARALAELRAIRPPYADASGKLVMEDLATERKWLEKAGGVWFDYRSMGNEYMKRQFMSSTEYTLLDLLSMERRAKAATVSTWSEEMAVDFPSQAPRLEVPTYFFIGKSDLNTPFELSYSYFQELDAPMGKRFVWFERSGHVPFLEEPEKFRKELLTVASERGGRR